jgi:hypothetical protein
MLRRRQRPRRDAATSGLPSAGRRRLLLVTGTPGTGKRQLGNFLVEEHAFLHIDLDNPDARTRVPGLAEGSCALLEATIGPDQDVVVTWSDSSDEALPVVRLLESFGFEWIWLDGDRGAAMPAAFTRGRDGSGARFVDPFASDGRFRAFGAVVSELLDPPATRRRTAWRSALPHPAGFRGRRGLVAGLALGAAAATAAGGYLAGAPSAGDDGARAARAVARAPQPALPKQGVLVPGRSLAGVKLGDSAETVRRLWGQHFVVCDTCEPMTWFYLYATGDPVGAGVTFRRGRVTAVFTLGMALGWRSASGVRVGQLLDTNDPDADGSWEMCSGFAVRSQPSERAVTSILTLGPAVYGFSLTRPSEPVCH